ncbi:Holliday junction branch migration protein RuvA [bacterium]|nr:Holliday junction branch migration protein RuvA [bacterium]
MIGRLRGMVAAKTIGSVVLDVGGVGYEIALNAVGVGDLPAVGEEAVVHTHLHVREDLMALYGFPTEEERDLFRLLLGASGVGPKLAMAVLGTLSPAELQRAVLTEDVDTLVAVPGIGKRSAQKLVLDLRARFQMPEAEAVLSGGSGVAEVRDALEGLGYQPAEIREALEGIDVAGSVEDLLKAALQRLGRG